VTKPIFPLLSSGCRWYFGRYGRIALSSLESAGRKQGLAFSRADFHATFGRRNPDILQQLFNTNFTEAEIRTLGEEKEELYREAARHGVDVLPGVRSLLELLQRAGIPQAIGSKRPRKNVELILDLTATRHFFRRSFRWKILAGVNLIQVFLLAAERLGIASVALSRVGGRRCRRGSCQGGGMKCIAITFVGHHPEEKLRAQERI